MRRYATVFLSLVLCGAALIVGFNWLVNPFELFSSPGITGFNVSKPEVRQRQRLAYPYALRHQRPEVIILGNSRAIHIDTDQPAWQGRRVFNLAVASSNIYEQQRYFQHALAVSDVRQAIYGVDYISFVGGKGPGFSEDRLAAEPDGTPRGFDLFAFARDAAPSLLSADALRASVATVRHQPRAGARAVLHDDQADRIRGAGGHHALFTELERGGATRPPGAQPSAAAYDAYRQLLRSAYAAHVELRLFISPEHARLQELWRRLGLGPAMAAWKEEVVRINEEEAARARVAPFPLWDFDDYNSITSESLPPAGDDRTLMQWYWEGSHYTARAAAAIVARVYGTPTTSALPADFGVPLHGRDLAAHLAATEQRRARYLESHPADVIELDRIVASARARFAAHTPADD